MRLRTLTISLLFTTALSAFSNAPRYVFYFIGDGMGMGPANITETYNRQVLKSDKRLTMMRFPVAGIAMTYSASSPVTDSAAAGTALSTGHKTKNGMLGMNPDTIPVYSIADDLKKQGYGIGIITTVAPDDATPAAFYAHVPARKMYYEIDCQAAEANIDFLAGASLRGSKDKDGNQTDVLDRFKKNNVLVTYDINVARKAKEKVLYLGNEKTNLNNNNVGYTIDSVSGAASLPEMTKACLDNLSAKKDRFFMMVEGGNIDHAAHANDGAAVVKEILNFNEAIQIAYDFYLSHPEETLIVITADHDTGGMAHSGGYAGEKNNLSALDYQHISKDRFTDEIKGHLADKNYKFSSWEDFKVRLRKDFSLFDKVKVSPEQEKSLKKKYEHVASGKAKSQKTLYNNFDEFSVEIYRLVNLSCGIKWISTSHSGNPVPVYAIGVGAEQFASLNNNIDIPQKIMSSIPDKEKPISQNIVK